MSRCSICGSRDHYESFHEAAAVESRAELRITDLEERVTQLEEVVRAIATSLPKSK